MWHLWDQTYSDPKLHIFRGSGPPTPMIYTPAITWRTRQRCCNCAAWFIASTPVLILYPFRISVFCICFCFWQDIDSSIARFPPLRRQHLQNVPQKKWSLCKMLALRRLPAVDLPVPSTPSSTRRRRSLLGVSRSRDGVTTPTPSPSAARSRRRCRRRDRPPTTKYWRRTAEDTEWRWLHPDAAVDVRRSTAQPQRRRRRQPRRWRRGLCRHRQSTAKTQTVSPKTPASSMTAWRHHARNCSVMSIYTTLPILSQLSW